VADRLTVNVRNDGPVANLDLHGEVDLASVDMLTAQVFRCLEADAVRQVFIDVQDVTFIDSCGIGGLIRCKNKSVEAGKALQVVGTQGWVADTFDVAGVSHYLARPGRWDETSAA
jgi:anti-anti-sigma factor